MYSKKRILKCVVLFLYFFVLFKYLFDLINHKNEDYAFNICVVMVICMVIYCLFRYCILKIFIILVDAQFYYCDIF